MFVYEWLLLVELHTVIHYIKFWASGHDPKRGQTAVKYGRSSPFLAMYLERNVNEDNVFRAAQAVAQHNGRLVM